MTDDDLRVVLSIEHALHRRKILNMVRRVHHKETISMDDDYVISLDEARIKVRAAL